MSQPIPELPPHLRPSSGSTPAQVRGAVILDPANPGAAILRLESGNGQFNLLMDENNVIPLLQGMLGLAEREISRARITRPAPNLFLPNGNGLRPPNLPHNGG